ncbi:MAG: hypothetical protein M3O22_03105 [Pseudomonadota bacterium]|nr:hypothetical protein [Pseudomonadota bacterium]
MGREEDAQQETGARVLSAEEELICSIAEKNLEYTGPADAPFSEGNFSLPERFLPEAAAQPDIPVFEDSPENMLDILNALPVAMFVSGKAAWEKSTVPLENVKKGLLSALEKFSGDDVSDIIAGINKHLSGLAVFTHVSGKDIHDLLRLEKYFSLERRLEDLHEHYMLATELARHIDEHSGSGSRAASRAVFHLTRADDIKFIRENLYKPEALSDILLRLQYQGHLSRILEDFGWLDKNQTDSSLKIVDVCMRIEAQLKAASELAHILGRTAPTLAFMGIDAQQHDLLRESLWMKSLEGAGQAVHGVSSEEEGQRIVSALLDAVLAETTGASTEPAGIPEEQPPLSTAPEEDLDFSFPAPAI